MNRLARKLALYCCAFLQVLLLVYVAASGPLLHHMAVKKKNTTVMPWRFYRQSLSYRLFPPVPPAHSQSPAGILYAPAYPSGSLLSDPENFYSPLFDAVEKTPLEAPLDKYLQWWGVSSMRICGNAMMIFPR